MFRLAGKVSIANSQCQCSKPWRGGLLSVLNEKGLTMSWRLCQTNAAAEIQESLEGIRQRCQQLGIEVPVLVAADNCCQIRNAVIKVLPNADVVLNVYHFLMRQGFRIVFSISIMALTVHLTRFLAVIINGTKNPHRAEVAKDITDAILKKRAANGKGAEYWTKEEQWSRKSGVWSAAASQVYTDQMSHVRKGCLVRKREDICSNGSRIEGSHKGWNSLQRAQPSGLAVFVALSHDHILRRNICIATANNKSSPFSSFNASTFGSHHTRLANYTAKFWNWLWLSKPGSSSGLLALPEMKAVSSDETFGLVNSECATTFGGLFSEVKAAPRTEDLSLLMSGLNEDSDLDLDLQVERGRVVDEFGIDSSLFDVPMVQAPEHAPSSQIVSLAGHAEGGSVPPNAEVAQLVEQSRNGMGRMASAMRRQFAPEAQGCGVHITTASNATTGAPDGLGAASSVRSFFATKRQAVASNSHGRKSTTPAAQSAPPDYATRVPLPPDGTGLTHRPRRRVLRFHEAARTAQVGVVLDDATEVGRGHENAKLESVNRSHNRGTTLKNTRALVAMLGTVEATVTDRLATGNFKSKKGMETFWRERCHAVQLLKEGQPDGDRKGKTRKPASCPRCKRLMYPGPTGSPENHKQGYCSDGVRSKPPDDAPPGYLPPWPQLNGVFSFDAGGTTFNPIPFLATLRDIYEKAVLGGGQSDEVVEFGAFTTMLHSRIVVRADGAILFQLYPEFELGPCPEGLFLKGDKFEEGRGGIEGTSYLRVDCLRND
ncbi:hypothetical protein EDB86DRAFT_2827581 [Lactarius hatsudake]|nr:hypothetical protein EDB86DRAFT_2827581 [Lactarius hatsudake]